MEHKVLGARALGKAIQLLFSFETNIPEQSLFELSRKLRFPPSTTHRLLKVMISHRLIQQDQMTKLYRLAARGESPHESKCDSTSLAGRM